MDKLTYLAELAEGLARWVPERERQDILRYYAEYFEEAGPGREAEVVAELGDPWALSCRLAVEGGFVSQEQANAWTPPRRRNWSRMLAVGITAAVLVFVVGPVVSLAANIGRTVGRAVTDRMIQGETTAYSEPEYYSPLQPGGGVTVVEEGTGPVAFVEPAYGGFWNSGDGYLEEFTTVDVDISLGDITVCDGVEYSLFIDQSANAGGYSLSWKVVDGVLKIRDGSSGKGSGWSSFKSLFQENSLSMNVVITVPGGGQLDKVDVKTALGDIFLANLCADKKVKAETKLGNVECYEVSTPKKLDLKSDLGNVILGIGELCDGLEIDLEASLGNIEANIGCHEWDCEYELETGLGEVTVNGAGRGSKAERKGALPYKLEAESGLGAVDVYFYAD